MTGLLVREKVLVDKVQSDTIFGYAKSEPFGDRSHVQFEAGEFVHMLPLISKVEVVTIKDEK